jgi:hypothetical protein
MAASENAELITYVDSSKAEWREFRPGSRWKVLYEDPATGQLNISTSSRARSWIRIVHRDLARTF